MLTTQCDLMRQAIAAACVLEASETMSTDAPLSFTIPATSTTPAAHCDPLSPEPRSELAHSESGSTRDDRHRCSLTASRL